MKAMNRRLTSILLLLVMGLGMAHAAGWIRINQLGYLPHATKVAVLISQEEVQATMGYAIFGFQEGGM